LEYQSTMVVGIVFDPNRNELFRAVKEAGTTLNGEKITVSQNESLSVSMLMASLPVATDASNPAVMRFLNVIPHAQSVQRSGSAALNLSNVAAGRLDGFWSTSLKPWDMAAGILLVTEAGGTVTTVDGSPFVVDDADLLASNGLSLHTEVQQYLV
jgi:myo-inositol-1(or 4)-monophosphatase